MKITIVLPPVNLSGGVRSTAVLASHLIKLGHDVLAVCPANRQPTFRRRVKFLISGKGWIRVPQQSPSEFDHRDVPLQVLDTYRPVTAADLPDADVVVATWWETADWVACLPDSKGAKVYFIRHHEIHDGLPKDKVAATYRLPLHKVTISQWLVDIMKNTYGDSDVSLVPNSIDTSKYFASPRGKQSEPTVGMMYSRTGWKGSDISLNAFKIAAQSVPNLKLIAFGLEEPSPELPLPENATYFHCPPQSSIRDIYAMCDAWLFGSRVEGFGRPILEAMACRTPVIATPAGAAPELLGEGAGILVKPEDPADMAKAIEQVANMTEDEWRSLSDSAFIKVTQYTWDDAARLCEEAFARALEKRKVQYAIK